MASKTQPRTPSTPDASSFDEELVPFADVLRKLVSTRPAHKVAAGPVKRNASKPPKKT